jgi:hypothetical protein
MGKNLTKYLDHQKFVYSVNSTKQLEILSSKRRIKSLLEVNDSKPKCDPYYEFFKLVLYKFILAHLMC